MQKKKKKKKEKLSLLKNSSSKRSLIYLYEILSVLRDLKEEVKLSVGIHLEYVNVNVNS